MQLSEKDKVSLLLIHWQGLDHFYWAPTSFLNFISVARNVKRTLIGKDSDRVIIEVSTSPKRKVIKFYTCLFINRFVEFRHKVDAVMRQCYILRMINADRSYFGKP